MTLRSKEASISGDARRSARILWVILIIAGAYVFWDAHRPFQLVDEYWYAEIVRNMLETGDLLTPRLGDRPEWIKPPLFYWLSLPFVAVVPSLEVGMRLLPGLAFLATIWLAFGIARKHLTAGAAPLAALVFFLTYDHLHIHGARNAVFEGVVNLELAVAFALNLRMWTEPRTVRWLGPVLALVFLTKSAVVAFPLAFTLANLWILRGRGPARRDLAVGVGLGVLVGLPWLAAVVAVHGRTVIDTMLLDQVLHRVVNDTGAALTMPGRSFGRSEPLGVLQQLGTYAQPWILLLPGALLALWVDRRRGLDARTHTLRLATVWLAIVVFLFLIARASWPWHPNSIHLPLALLSADLLARFLREENTAALDCLVVAAALTGLFFLRAPFAHDPFAKLPILCEFDPALLSQIGVFVLLFAVLFVVCRRRRLPSMLQLTPLIVVPVVAGWTWWGMDSVVPVGVAAAAFALAVLFGSRRGVWPSRPAFIVLLATTGIIYLAAPFRSPHRWDRFPPIAQIDARIGSSGAPKRDYVVKGATYYAYVVIVSAYRRRARIEYDPRLWTVTIGPGRGVIVH